MRDNLPYVLLLLALFLLMSGWAIVLTAPVSEKTSVGCINFKEGSQYERMIEREGSHDK